MEVIDYLETQQFVDKPSKNGLIKTLSLSKATYYSIKNHKPSKTEHKRNEVKNNILTMFYKFSEIYGAPKIYKEFVKIYGEEYVAKRTVSVYMRQMGLNEKTPSEFSLSA